MACFSMPTALLGSSLLSGAGSLISGGMQAGAATDAAAIQAAAATRGQDLVQQMFQTGKKMVMPFQKQGVAANSALSTLIGTNPGGNPLTAELTRKFQPTMEELAKTPGYQFALNQGMDATQNSAAAKGLGASGAALKGAANFAEGLASTTYQQQFQNYWSQNQNIYNMLQGQVGTGLDAAKTVAGLAADTGKTQAGLLTSGAAATAAGVMGSASALGSGISGALGSLGSAGMLYGLSGMGSGGSSGGGLFGRGDGGMANSRADAAQDLEYLN